MERTTAFRQVNFKRKSGAIKDRVRERCLERLRQHRQDIEQSRRLQQVKAPTRARGGWVSHPTGAVQPRFGDAAAAHTSIVDSILGDEWAALQANPVDYGLASGMEPHLDPTDSAAGAMEEDDFDRVDDWPVSAAEAQTAGDGDSDEGGFDEAAELAYIERVFQEIKEELQAEEQKMIEEYEREIQALDEESRAQIESEEFAQTDGVVCPVCTKNWLLQRFNAIFCVCGFRFENRYGGVSLHTLKMCLESAAERHSSECPTVPQFGIESEPATNIQRLILRCADCDSFEIVI